MRYRKRHEMAVVLNVLGADMARHLIFPSRGGISTQTEASIRYWMGTVRQIELALRGLPRKERTG